MNEKKKEPFAQTVSAIIVLGAIPLCALVNTYLWGWFIVPFGAPPITLAHAMGLELVFVSLRGAKKADEDSGKDPWEKAGGELSRFILFPLLVWGCGALVSRFM